MLAEGLVYPVVPECSVAVDASGVDPEQDGDALAVAPSMYRMAHVFLRLDQLDQEHQHPGLGP